MRSRSRRVSAGGGCFGHAHVVFQMFSVHANLDKFNSIEEYIFWLQWCDSFSVCSCRSLSKQTFFWFAYMSMRSAKSLIDTLDRVGLAV